MQKVEGRIKNFLTLLFHSAFCLLPSAFLRRSGQALIESCLVIALICLILAGLFQLAQIFSAKMIMAHASARGARALAVGFNQFMVSKAVRVAAIGDAGQLTFPEVAGGPREQMAVERGRIPLYLGAEWHMLNGILQYEDWDTINWGFIDLGGTTLRFSISQEMPLAYFQPLFNAFYGNDTITISAEQRIDNHAALYLE